MPDIAQKPLSRAQKFSSKNLSLGALATDKAHYVIPVYQRPYAWTATQVQQLMRDLLDFYRTADNKSSYSLGTIVCDEETPGMFSILDGQQRLTTIDLLLGEIDCRLGRRAGESHQRIISAYRYLSGMETSESSPLPACTSQRNCIAAALSDFIDKSNQRDNEKSRSFLRTFEECVLERVHLRRVVIPLSSQVENEAPAMFEIINMRGQKLSALDILKSRLLSRFDESDRFGRSLFTHLWRSTEELLASPTKAEAGYDLKGWKTDQTGQPSAKEGVHQASISEELTIDEIIDMDDDQISVVGNGSAADGQSDRNAESANASDTDETERFDPPIDMMNMLVIANELLKHEKMKRSGLSDSAPFPFQALATTEFDKRFDHIVQAEEPGTADVWQLMGALSVVLQTVGAWGRYRKTGTDEYEGEPDNFNQLIQTFMAANSFSNSAQYWLLLLSATALENSIGPDGELPADAKAFLGMKKPAFVKLRNIAALRLQTWAFLVAQTGQDNATAAVLRLVEESPSEGRALEELKEAQASVEATAPFWRYDDGSISQFDLFLTDYLLWVDGHAQGDKRFAFLKGAMDQFVEGAQTEAESEVADAIGVFDWNAFVVKANSLRIVGRSDIEHWLARNRADLGNDAKKADEELACRHGFGNLALINNSDNSSLGNGAPAGKAEIVLNRMSNPTPKLLWLAVLSQKFPRLSGRHVEGLSKLWASYIGQFPFA